MLQGRAVIDGHEIYIRGYDTGPSYALMVTSKNDTAYFDAGHAADADVFSDYVDDGYLAAQWNIHRPLGVTVNGGSIKVETFPRFITVEDASGKSKKKAVNNDVNKSAFGVLGSILRGMKNQCRPVSRRIDPTEIFEEVLAKDSYWYDVTGGEVELTQGIVSKLKYETDRVFVELTESGLMGGPVEFMEHGVNIKLNLDGFPTKNQNVGDWGLVEDGNKYYTIAEIIENNKGQKNYDWVLAQDYHMIDTFDQFKELMKMLLAWDDGEIAFDTETTGLNINFRSKEGLGDTLVGMVFSIREGESYYVPVAHKLFPNIATEAQMPYVMETYVKPVLEKKRLVGHNVSYDWKVMWDWGIICNFVADTLTAIELTWNKERNGFPLSLKAATSRLLGRDSFELDDMVPNGVWDYANSFADLPYETTKYYACADTDNTLVIWNHFKKNRILEEYAALPVFQIEVVFSMCVGYSEYYGMYANAESVTELQSKLEARIVELYAAMEEIAGRPFKVGSPTDLRALMFEELGMPVIKMTKEGGSDPSTDKSVIKALLGFRNPDESARYPFVELYQEYKNAALLVSNFCKPFNKMSNDGFFHSSVRQFLETGRVSISKPNYQSFNDDVKKYITARNGYYMFDTDFSSVEYRVLVSMAGEDSLIEQFYDSDFDYHRRMASLLHGVTYEKVTPELRGQSKGLNFGIPYGMSVIGLAGRMFGDKSPESIAKANKLYHKYFDVQPAVRRFFDKVKDQAVREEYNSTFFGRRRAYDKTRNKESRIRRQAGNHPIQGTAADLYKMGVGRLFRQLIEKGYLGKVLLTGFVHDETVIESHKSINPAELVTMVSDAMMIKLDGWCPLYIGAGMGHSWYEAKKTELPVQVQEAIKEGGPDSIPWWDGDVDKLVEWEEFLIADFAKDSVIDYLAVKENWGKKISLVAGGQVKDALKTAKSGGRINGVQEGIGDISIPESTLDQMVEFGRVFGVSDEVLRAAFIEPVEEDDGGVDYDSMIQVRPEDIKFDEEDYVLTRKTSAETFGSAILDKIKYVMIKADSTPTAWNDIIMQKITANPGDYKVCLVVGDQGEVVETDKMVSPDICSQLITLYGNLQNAMAGARW